ncbi:MAG TPA: hypothetical protein VHW02_02525 [Rhizomicrobium sp.]|jgi:hypothetical protein|nr:hypothetical protein [Rhizomicrobium sp.]
MRLAPQARKSESTLNFQRLRLVNEFFRAAIWAKWCSAPFPLDIGIGAPHITYVALQQEVLLAPKAVVHEKKTEGNYHG